MTYLEGLEGKEKLDLIETLREVTEGKVRSLRSPTRSLDWTRVKLIRYDGTA